MNREPAGYFCIVLHAHLPFVREPAHDRFLEENWFFEAMIESYLPLLRSLHSLVRDRVDFRLTVSLSPTLVSMFDDELLRSRFRQRIGSLIELSEKEVMRHRYNPSHRRTAEFYRERFGTLRDFYEHRLAGDVTRAFRELQNAGHVEVLTTAATHGYLPLLRHDPASVRAQIEIAVNHYRQAMGREPQGMWLPECGYYNGLDEILAAAGVRYFFVESHGVLNGDTLPRNGVYAPVVCPSGVAAFGRDPECSKEVWSAREGFPGDPDYREFYRDIGFDLPEEYVGPYIGPDGVRIATGMKYYRITGSTDAKEPYDRDRAVRKAAAHADVFADWRREQIEWVSERMDRRPIVVALYDAELFGHWWFEGPEWLESFLRRVAAHEKSFAMATPSEYLAEYPDAQVMTPADSSWGANGHSEMWLDKTTDWIYPELMEAGATMAKLVTRYPDASGVARRILNQAGRELLLAQSSDWAFILKSGTATQFATQRLRDHLSGFRALTAELSAVGGEVTFASSLLEELEQRNNLFPELDVSVFRDGAARSPAALRRNPDHVVFLSAEAAPLVKVGGLADVVGALPAALARWGIRVTVILPAYATIDREAHGIRPLADGLVADLDRQPREFSVLEARSPAPGVRILLVEEPQFFGRAGVYVDPETSEEYPDTAERFVFFTRAALETTRWLGEPVDIVHSHDHQTALASALLKRDYADDPILGRAATVYTLHNLGYQGVYDPSVLRAAGWGEELAGSPFEHYGRVNFMKAGIQLADRVNTVSEGYAREICSDAELGAGLGDVLRARGSDFGGILNGIDLDEWNPAADPHLPESYSVDDLSGKRAAKRRVFDTTVLDGAFLGRPLIGMITRLVDQKGLDIVAEALPRILELPVAFVVLGTGLAKYETFLSEAEVRWPGRVAALLKFDNGLAHLIEAGADIFLMPSLYEPCGLNQMYSLRYGTVPVVRRTGGLADTVVDDDDAGGNGVGFSFADYSATALEDAIRRAVRAFEDRDRWQGIVRRGMTRDFSWDASALRYINAYREALVGPRIVRSRRVAPVVA